MLHKTILFGEDKASFFQGEDSNFDLFASLGEFRRNYFHRVVRHMLEAQSALNEVV